MTAFRISAVLTVLLLGVTPVSAQQSRQVKPRNQAPISNRVPTLTLVVGSVTHVVEGVTRTSAATVCAGDRVPLRASTADPDKSIRYAWISTGGQIVGEGPEVVLDTTGLTPGDYHVTAAATYPGSAVCTGDCTAYDTATIRVSNCPPLIVCFTTPVLAVTPESRTVQAGEVVTFTTLGVSGGQGYGRVTYSWKSSVGEIIGNGTSARLDTTGLAPQTVIEVGVTATSEFANCSAEGSARLVMATPPPTPESRELTPCVTFKRNNSRVDNACKNVLTDAARALQADAQARLVVDAFRSPAESEAVALARGKNVRDRLVDGSIGVTVEANRIVVRVGGVSSDGSQIKLYLVPEGAALPPGPQAMRLGPVERERKSAADVLTQRHKAKGAPRR